MPLHPFAQLVDRHALDVAHLYRGDLAAGEQLVHAAAADADRFRRFRGSIEDAFYWHSSNPFQVDVSLVVIDNADKHMYHPLAEPDVGIELARVRTPEDALAFVQRFGLLRQPLSLPGQPLKPLRESFRAFEIDAEELRYILETARLVRRGAGTDPDAIGQLRQLLLIPENAEVSVCDEKTGEYVTRRAGDVYSPDERFVGADDRTIVMYAHEYHVAHRLNEGIADSPPCVYDRAFMGESVPPGSLRVGVRPSTLAGVCYLSVALALADRMPVGVCADPTCGRPFFITDRRQRFCSRACGNRVRFRRFTDKHGTATTTKGGD